MAQAILSDFETGVWSPAKSLVRILVVALGALSLSWAAAINGQAFVHPDTVGYTRGPDVAVSKLFGPRFTTEWAQKKEGAKALAVAASPGHAPTAEEQEVLGGRSIYYGVLAYLGALAGGFWLTVLVQGLAVALLVEILMRGLRLFSLATYAGVIGLLSLATAAPFFVAYVMPDIWAGVAIGALAAVFALSGRLSRPDTVLLGAMTIFAALAHSSVAPVLAAMLLGGGLLWFVMRGAFDPRPGLAIGVLALVIAAAGGMAFSTMVKHTVGKPPVNPPFLTARVMADGTGVRYLHDHCAGKPFAVCQYASRFPMDVDHFLWGTTAKDGVFQTISADQRRALSDQDARFAASVADAYPVSQALASVRNAALQVVDIDLTDFNYKASVRAGYAQTLPAGAYAAQQQSRAFHEGWPLAAMTLLQSAVAIAALGLIGFQAARPMRGSAAMEPSAAMTLAVLILVGVLANGVVCGVLSTLYGRYEARVVWLLPLAAALLTMARARITARRA